MKEEILKDKKKAQSNYYIKKLEKYIKKNGNLIFSKENEADAWCDFILFEGMKTDRKHLVMPTEPFLVDRNYQGEHFYCICTISENRKITSEIPVIRVSELSRDVWRNGYFLLPNLVTNWTN